jgi:hypothetical protein
VKQWTKANTPICNKTAWDTYSACDLHSLEVKGKFIPLTWFLYNPYAFESLGITVTSEHLSTGIDCAKMR